MTGRCSSRDGNHQCRKELHEKNISDRFPFFNLTAVACRFCAFDSLKVFKTVRRVDSSSPK